MFLVDARLPRTKDAPTSPTFALPHLTGAKGDLGDENARLNIK